MKPRRQTLLGMFAKYWEPGRVKTRLASGIGDEQAAAIYCDFIRELACRFRDVADARQLVYSPPNSRASFNQFAGDHWDLQPQSSGDLGRRMTSFFESSFSSGADSVVLIGSDSPNVPRQFVEEALTQLEKVPVVLGPSEDGGYYLVGISNLSTQRAIDESRTIPDIFSDMQWSTENVLEQTLTRLQHSETPVAQLPTWYDIDSIVELRRLASELDTDGMQKQLRAVIHQHAGF